MTRTVARLETRMSANFRVKASIPLRITRGIGSMCPLPSVRFYPLAPSARRGFPRRSPERLPPKTQPYRQCGGESAMLLRARSDGLTCRERSSATLNSEQTGFEPKHALYMNRFQVDVEVSRPQ